MSKAALYKGLSQGLMALGQGVGKAIEVTSLEKMRQENLAKNWAREDRIRQEDNTRSDQRFTKQTDLRQQQIEATQANTQGLMDFRKQRANKSDEQFATNREDRINSQSALTKIESDESGSYQVQYNKDGQEINRIQLQPQKDNTKLIVQGIDNEIKALIEYNGGDDSNERLNELRAQRNKILGVGDSDNGQKGDYTSNVSGLSVDDVITKFMQANPSISKEQAIQLAVQQKRIQ